MADNQRLISYLGSNLGAVNLIEEYQQKRLPVTALFYKMCNSFPKDKLGSMKGAFKHIQIARYQSYTSILSEEEISSIIKQQNNLRPKVGQYVEFLFLSYLQTTVEQPELIQLPSAEEDISQGWDFMYRGQKYDITTNQNKITRPEVKAIKLKLPKILDQDNLIVPDACLYFNTVLQEFNIILAMIRQIILI